MTSIQLFENIVAKGSFLCVGLDTDVRKLPPHLKGEGAVFGFNRAIIDATAPYAVCYKPNLAFYEELGPAGLAAFSDTCRYIRENYPDMFIIADAKRGDIGNTSAMYARAFFENDTVDAVTLSPYMGRDTVEPFMKYDGKWSVILALTSNPGADDFQTSPMADGEPLYKHVLRKSSSWGSSENTMYVVGATRASTLSEIRAIVPNHFLLVPGVGAQGGSLEDVARFGMNAQCGLLVNSSRAIIYASSGQDFALAAAESARAIQLQMAELLKKYL